MFLVVDGFGVFCMYSWGFCVEKQFKVELEASINLVKINVICCKGYLGNGIQWIFYVGVFLIQCFIFIYLLNKQNVVILSN